MPRHLSDTEKYNWHVALADVKPLKGKRRIPPPPIPLEELKKKPIKAKTPIIRVATSSKYDGKLDLHGLTEDGAHQALMIFMKSEIARGSKKLLIITGKGDANIAGLSGILRTNVPRWLDVHPISNHIRSIESAPANLGGDGAYIVTLKAKKR